MSASDHARSGIEAAPRRVDGREKVTGRARYAAEFRAPGTVHAVLEQSPIARGRIESIDSTEAEAQPGVLLVMTHRNRPPLQPLKEEYTSVFPGERRTPLEDEVIHYAGQHVAVVVAETLEQAQYAAGRLRICYVAEEAVLDPRHAMEKAYRPPHFAKNSSESLQNRRGEPERVRGERRIDVEYETPVVTHNPIEPSATLASWEGNKLTLHDSTRWVDGTRMFCSTMLGVPQEAVRVICPYVGGAFGSKGFLWQHVVLAALAAKLVGRPVLQVLSRAQMFTSVGHRPQTFHTIGLGCDGGGRLEVLRHRSLNDTSPVANFVEPAAMISRHLYSCPNVEIVHEVAPTNIATPCFMRAPGEAPGMFATESAMDELAYAAGLDPMEFRLRNYAEKDEEAGRPWSSKRLRECYAEGAERFGWAKRPAEPGTMRRGEWKVGWGMATAAYPGRRAESTVLAELSKDGEAVFRTAAHELGTGTRTMMAQVAAEALGIPLERVRVELGDSEFPPSPVAGASQTTATVGPAVLRAAGDLRQELVLLAVSDPASRLCGLKTTEVSIEGGVLRSMKDAGCEERYEDVLARMSAGKLEASAEAKPGPEKEELTWSSFGAHFAEVLVHADTGEVRVSRWVGVFDAGRVLNPMLARSQIYGGVIFGIGMALFEQTMYDPGMGAPVNPNLSEYLLPTCADVPEIEVSFLDVPDVRFNPLGVRGLGELGVTGTAGAIANAVWHATGRRFRRLPITTDRMFSAERAGMLTS